MKFEFDGPSADGRIRAMENPELGLRLEWNDPVSPELVLERAGIVQTLPFCEARKLGVEVALSTSGSSGEFCEWEFAFDARNSGWIPRAVRWKFSRFVMPGNQDVLVLPDKAGARWIRPAERMFEPLIMTVGHWRDRSFVLRERGLLPEEKKGAVSCSSQIRCSMPFVSYVSERGGFYFGMHDAGFENTTLEVGAERGKNGVSLAMTKSFNRPVSRWKCKIAFGLHAGDWRKAASFYRKFYNSTGIGIRRPVPIGAGVHAHYDLRWQDGTIFHRYRDLPVVAREAAADGFEAMVFGGWNKGGFDNNYPCFRPDPELGTEEELKEAVRAIHAKGMKALFYVNGYSYDRAEKNFEKQGRSCAVQCKDGSTVDVRWGTRTLTGMCMGSEKWRDILLGNIRYVLDTIGADGLYLDQFNVIPPECHAPGHIHDRSLTARLLETFREIRRESGDRAIFITEHPLDALSAEVDYQDMETLWNNQQHTFPELFRYTFPECGAMDLLIQKPWPCTDPEFEGRFLARNFDRLLLTGTLLWCYDHAPHTAGFEEHFKLGQSIRARFAAEFAAGRYRNTDNIASIPSGCEASCFELPDGGMLLVVANHTGKPCELKLQNGRTVTFSSASLEAVKFKGIEK